MYANFELKKCYYYLKETDKKNFDLVMEALLIEVIDKTISSLHHHLCLDLGGF